MARRIISALILAVAVACGGASQPSAPAASPGTEEHTDRIPRQRSVERYVAMLESAGRAEWQRPDELVAALQIAPGSRVADVGSGSGYFLPQLQSAVGPEGWVVAQDIDPQLVAHLRERVERERWARVEPRLGHHDDPNLEANGYDLILMVDVYHHVADPPSFLAHVMRALRPGGRFVVVDFPPGDHVPEAVSGSDHRIPRDQVVEDATSAGMSLLREHDFLTYQFMVELVPGPLQHGPETDP